MDERTYRILVVDDDPDIRAVLRVYLESFNFEVEEMQSGDEAVAVFEKTPTDHGFDLVIVDQVMPGIDGLTAFEKFQKIDGRTPVIMLTGFPTISLAIRFIQMGGINFLTKPFDPRSDVLMVLIKEAINYKRIKRAQEAAVQENQVEFLVFQDDNANSKMPNIICGNSPWKMLIVDDDESVHGSTKLILENLIFDGRPLEFFSAHSTAEAKSWLDDNSDVALVLSDTVMETEYAGFDIVKHIRGTMGNRLIRIILRTAENGDFPEHKVVLDHEIDGFLTKHDASIQRLAITVATSIRAYRDLLIIEKHRRRGLVKLEKSLEENKFLQARVDELEAQMGGGHARAAKN